MIQRVGRQTLRFETMPRVVSYACAGSKKEMEGPLGKMFDIADPDPYFGQKTWEKAESTIQKKVLAQALKKGGLQPEQIDYVFAGDLLNQCIASSFGLRGFHIPLVGLYGACSTMAESLCMAGIFVESECAEYAAGVASSHFCTAERQFRMPLPYGSQRTPTAQWTVTGGGCVVLGKQGDVGIKHVTIGRIVDLGVNDANNMGAAMAPAAADTIAAFLRDTGTTPQDYDLIITGDLGYVGSDLLLALLDKEGIDARGVHDDCGKRIFDRQRQDVHSGGSGCGCSASVLCGQILPLLQQGKLGHVLFVATGALLSATSAAQGESIPGIAHLVHFVKEK